MANTLIMFDSVKLAGWNDGHILSGTYRAALISAGWTPDIDTGTLASVTAQFCSQLSGDPANKDRQCPGPGQATILITKTAAGVIKFDLSDIGFTATSGSNLSAQYGLLWKSKSPDPPFAYWELSSAEVVSTQINVTWPAEGLFETSDNV